MTAVVNANRVRYRLQTDHLELPSSIVKRDGSRVTFDLNRIGRAVEKCYDGLETEPKTPAEQIVQGAAQAIAARYHDAVPTVEQVQDIVELTLLSVGEMQAANAYMTYRDRHARLRGEQVPDEVRQAFADSERWFPTQLQQFQFFDKYARFNWDKMRRETWEETVDRNIEYLQWTARTHLNLEGYPEDANHPVMQAIPWDRLREGMLNFEAMPSMRSLSQAGDAAKRNSLAIYNCSYAPIVDPQSYGEIIRISMAGCGVGWSVERKYVEQFPRVAWQNVPVYPLRITVEDSAEGWAQSLERAITEWMGGGDVEFNYDLVRPAGTPLITKGGRASGPGPLQTVHEFCRTVILRRQGSFLTSLDCHDMACVTAGAAVSGGQRRTAAISLFDFDDELMRTSKNGRLLDENPWRWNANNSAVWPDELTEAQVAEQMLEMVKSQRGEPGIFSRANANRLKPARRREWEFGTNPCGEINLRPWGLCNLTIAVAREHDTLEDLTRKVELATILGVLQSLATDFPGMRPEWKENAEDERLLGVDITGQADCLLLTDGGVEAEMALAALREHSFEVACRHAEQLGINRPAAITCNKPAGNSSQLLNTSSGIGRRHSPYHLRRTRVSAVTPLYRVLRDAGVPMSPENGQEAATADTWVVAWPARSPEGVRTKRDLSAIQQCEFWLMNKTFWTEHNPSVTITYRDDEVIDLMRWVADHRTVIGGMAFLPEDDAAYEQMPYEEITAEQYAAAVAAFPQIDFSLLYAYEHSDMTTAAQELACMSGNCDA